MFGDLERGGGAEAAEAGVERCLVVGEEAIHLLFYVWAELVEVFVDFLTAFVHVFADLAHVFVAIGRRLGPVAIAIAIGSIAGPFHF